MNIVSNSSLKMGNTISCSSAVSVNSGITSKEGWRKAVKQPSLDRVSWHVNQLQLQHQIILVKNLGLVLEDEFSYDSENEVL